jgi:hypothetical protein
MAISAIMIEAGTVTTMEMDAITIGRTTTNATGAGTEALYSIHGLTVSSEFPLPELPAGAGTADLSIRRAKVPSTLSNARERGVLFDASPEGYLLRVPGVGRFLARDGREILVEPDGGSALDIATFVLGSPLSALLHQRGVLLLHASGVLGAKGAILLAGHSGRGKSTAAAALALRGYPVITDDAAVVTLDPDGRPVVHSGGTRINLWQDALDRLGHTGEVGRRVREGIEKFAVPVPISVDPTPKPLVKVFLLGTHNRSEVVVESLADGAKFEALRRHTRIVRAMRGLGNAASHFRIASAVAAGTPIVSILRPIGRDSLDEVVAQLAPSLR